MVVRSIIRIEEDRCTGCGLCVPACAEGAIRIINGKAKLVSDALCDGLGACVGRCPHGALTIEERDAEDFDEEAVKQQPKHVGSTHQPCPSARVSTIGRRSPSTEIPTRERPMLSQWPIQLMLVPPNAPFLREADLLIAADCVPFAYTDFHEDFLKGKVLLVGCPKLDDNELYARKLADMVKLNHVNSVTVVNMEVPCCFGLYHIAKESVRSSNRAIPLLQEVIGVNGVRKVATALH